ncbi:isoflavone reductase family protein [Mycena filopes]|nr:isoflavone reductase family protein [Mycena filopes]
MTIKVLLLGATGETGGSILKGLLNDADFEVEALVRPSSASKPAVKALGERGVGIRVVDIEGPKEDLVKALAGVDVLISTIDAGGQLAQLQLATAAKEAGVKRFVPCAFITVASPGTMSLRDKKEEVYQHIWRLHLPYTIIDVGYWHQLSFPTLPSGRVDYAAIFKPKVEIYAGGTKPSILIDLRDIGPLVARVIKDDRTLNKFVITTGDVLSQNEIFKTMEELSGEKIERKYLSAESVIAKRAEHAAAHKADPDNFLSWLQLVQQDYNYNKFVRGDNTPEYAKYLGYLDTKELYPEFRPRRFVEFARELLDGKAEKMYPDMVIPAVLLENK